MTDLVNINELDGYGIEVAGIEVYATIKSRRNSDNLDLTLWIRTPTEQDEDVTTITIDADDETIVLPIDDIISVANEAADYYGEFADESDDIQEFVQTAETAQSLYNVMTAAEAAALINVAPSTVSRAAERGDIVGRKAGRIWLLDRASVMAYNSPETFRWIVSCRPVGAARWDAPISGAYSSEQEAESAADAHDDAHDGQYEYRIVCHITKESTS